MDQELIEKLIHKINDKLAKVVMQMPESAIEYVGTFLPEIAESLDLEDMVLQNSNFLLSINAPDKSEIDNLKSKILLGVYQPLFNAGLIGTLFSNGFLALIFIIIFIKFKNI